MKNFLLHKITLRVVYIATAFTTAHVLAFASSASVQAVLSKAGILFQITDPVLFKEYMTGVLLVGGEFVYRSVHTKFILPHVIPVKQGEVK